MVRQIICNCTFAFLLALYLPENFSLVFSEEPKESLPKDLKTLMIRVSTEREQVVQYKMEANISEKIRRPDGVLVPARRGVEDMKIYFEYSKVDDHFVVAVCNGKQSAKDFLGWMIGGRTQNMFLRGASGGKLAIQDYQAAASKQLFQG